MESKVDFKLGTDNDYFKISFRKMFIIFTLLINYECNYEL